MTDKDTLPVWKKLYQIVSGSNEHVTPDIVDSILEICQVKLVNVLLNFEIYTTESFEEWKKVSESMQISQDDEMCSFIHRLSKELDLDVNLAWSIICNFLIFDYYGKVDELKSIIRYEANMKSLIDHVWYFYSADRMFLLKTLRYIFENLTDKDHMLFEQFNTFIEEIDLKKLWKNLLKTFEYLITEVDKDKSNRVASDTLTRWVQRNNREQTEVLLLITLVADLIELNGDELVELLRLFMRHGFGRHPLFFGAGSLSRPKDIVDIKNAEIGVILTVIHRYWQKNDLCKMIPKEVEKDLEQYQIQGDNSAILFIWVIFKSTLSEKYLDYCRNALEALIEKKVFKSLADFITLNIFQNCKVGEILIEAVNRLFIEFSNVIEDNRYIYEQDGLVTIICELFKRPYLHALDKFGQFFEIGLDMFPYILDNFLDMVEALIISKEYYEKALKLLHNCPTYCTELMWPYASDAVRSEEERNLFLGTDRFIIPMNTLTERCSCFGTDVIKFHYKYDYFQVIEQYIRSLTMWAVNRGEYNKLIFDYVLRANKFLSFWIKHYRGDFTKNKIIKPLLQRLDCVPTYYNKGGFRNYDFFYVYFEAKCSLVIYQNVDFHETFPLMIRKGIFPTVSSYKVALEELRILYSNSDTIMYKFLKDEEGLKDHKLLLLFGEIIYDVLKKKILYKEILYGGLWYMLYAIFPTHQQYSYEEAEPFQQAKILNVCLQAFTTVLRSDFETEDEKELYNLVRDSFLKSDSVINTLCSAFVRDKFYLQNLMHQESNWLAGPTLIVIETVRLELTLLLLMFKARAQISKGKFYIDDKTHIFARYASGYFVNAYNCSLAVLAGRFLEVLARDENIPLMSCLCLDHEQVQILFLERLRDPMEDEDVKLNILDLISTCIFHQTGMTAAFFNVQSSKKWYYTDSEKHKLEADTVGDFMIDYLHNIKKSVTYLRSPLQVGILKVMANLWECEKQHLIKEVTALPTFWSLLADPLYRTFDLAPLVYSYILRILSINFTVAERKPEAQEKFFSAVEKFLTDQKQLRLWQQYLFKIFSEPDDVEEYLSEKKVLMKAWSELLVTIEKQTKVTNFPNAECKYFFIELAFEGIQRRTVHSKILSTWLDYILVVVDIFGLNFEQRLDQLSRNALYFARIINDYYEEMSLKDKTAALAIILKVILQLKKYFDDNTSGLVELLEEIGPIVDLEHSILEEKVWDKLKNKDPRAREYLGPWALIISIANAVLTMKNCKEFTVWFANRKYLPKMVQCTCDLLTYKEALPAGKIALYSLTLYVQSPLAYDFLKINMLQFYDRVEPMISMLLSGHFSKVNLLDFKEAWLIAILVMKFTKAFLQKFKKNALETCFAFLTLNEHILKHIMNLPENTVDFRALDLLTQTLIFYDEILSQFKIEWYRKSNKTFTFMIDGIRKVINACVYLCLRPKHIGFYYLDNYYRLVPLHQEAKSINDLMISVINRLIGILSLAVSCLYKLNSSIIEMFDYFEPDESIIVLINNDFSVPRFELPIPCDLTYGKLLCLAHFLCKTLNQLHHNKKQSSMKINEGTYEYHIGLVEHQDPSDYMPNQKLSSFLRYLYEYSGLIDPWINNLNPENVQKTADMLMTFIAQQAFLTIQILEPHQVPFYKRNLSGELQFFNEYVKKRTSELLESHAAASIAYSGDMDIIKRYLVYNWQKNKQNEVAQKNFLLMISHWFSNICHIH